MEECRGHPDGKSRVLLAERLAGFDSLIEIVPYETTGGKLDDAEQQAHHSDGTEKENRGVFPCFDNVHGGGAGDHDKRAAP